MDILAMHLPRRTFGTKVSSGRELDEFNSDLKSKYQYWWRVLQHAARGNLNPDWFAKPRLMEPLLRLIATEDEIKCLILANERSNILSQPQPEPEPELKLEPKPEPEWESKPEPEIELDTEIPLELNPEIEPKLEPEPGPEPKPELELMLEQEPELEWDMTLDLEPKTEFTTEFKTKYKTDSDLELDSRNFLMFTADVCRAYDPFEESNDGMEYWCEEPPNKRSRVYAKCPKRSPFIEEEYGNRILTSFVCFSSPPCSPKPIRCVAQKRTYDEMNPLDELLELRRNTKLVDPTPTTPTRSILKSQCNVNNVISSYSNSNQSCQPLSDHQEKKVYQQNQDDQKEMIMKFHKQIMIGHQERKDNPSTEVKELLSSGSSPKTETDTESEDSVNFQHDQINVTEKLSQYLSEGAMASTRPMMNNASVLINKVRRHWRKDEETQRQIEDDIKRNTLSDHCYHLNEPQSMDRLGLNELSESEEEDVDVESFENPSYLNFTPLKRNAQPVAKVDMATSLRRPRGRPPGPNSAKRKNVRVNQAPLPAHTPAPTPTPRRIGRPAGRRQNYRQSRDHLDEEEVEKRSLHNNMERQRRIGLKMLFEDLKSVVPSIANNEKVSKVLILKQAKDYINSLGVIKKNYEPELRKLQKQQQLLKKKLEALRDLSR